MAEAPDWQRLLECREDYRIGTVPVGGLLLTAGADVQKDRIEVSVWALGRGKESWLVEHRVLMGDTARDEVWKALASVLRETWTHETGASLDWLVWHWIPASRLRKPMRLSGVCATRV